MPILIQEGAFNGIARSYVLTRRQQHFHCFLKSQEHVNSATEAFFLSMARGAVPAMPSKLVVYVQKTIWQLFVMKKNEKVWYSEAMVYLYIAYIRYILYTVSL